MFTSLRRAVISAVTLTLAFTGLTATSASADTESLTVGTGITVAYGQSVDVPFTFTTATTELLVANIQAGGGSLDMQSYADAHTTLAWNSGNPTSGAASVVGTPSQITDLLAHLRVKSPFNGNTESIDVSASVYSFMSPSIDSSSGHAYQIVWNGTDYLSALCKAKYVNNYVSYDEQQAPTGDHCYAGGAPLVLRTYQGVTGHLLQPNSQAETDFVNGNLWGTYYQFWVGASDYNNDGHWKWNGGANDGVEFWTGDSNGTRVSGDYTPWAAGNPSPTFGSTDNTAILTNTDGTWSSADLTNWNSLIYEFDLPQGSTASPYVNQYAQTSVTVTGAPFDTCLNVSDGFNSDVTVGGTNQAAAWTPTDVVNFSYGRLAKNMTNLKNDTSQNTASVNNVGFDHSYNGTTGNFDGAHTCLIKGSDGSKVLRADSPNGYDIGNGLNVSYETKYYNDGATIRQTVTYTNTSNALVNAGDVKFAGSYDNGDGRRAIADSAYGSSFTDKGRGGISTYWGGSSTTVVNGNKFTPLTAVDNTKWSDLQNEETRFNAWQNIPNAYFDGISGTVANWGSNSVAVSVNARPSMDTSADVVFSLGNIPAGQSRSVVVFTEVHDLGVILRPYWNESSAQSNLEASRGHEFVGDYSVLYGEGIYTYAVTDGALPSGLSLDAETGIVTGTTNDAVGDQSFQITATPVEGYPELSENSRTFTISVIDVVAGDSFETGTYQPWTAINRQIDLGTSYIAGCRTVDTADYSGLEAFSDGFDATDEGVVNGQRGGTEDNNIGGYRWQLGFSTGVTDSDHTDGTQSLRLHSVMDPTEYGYDVVRGPAVYSPEFSANTNQVYAFDWQARGGGDSFDIFGYLLNTDTCAQTEVIDAVGDESLWSKAYVHIPANGHYRFVFVSGTYDKSGGQYAGADLYLDNFQVGNPVAPVWTDEVVSDGVLGTAYTNALTASGFPDPIVSLVGGSLPDGLSMDSHGNITGTPTAVGTYTFKVKADNGIGTIYTTVTIHITDTPANNVYWSDNVLPLTLYKTGAVQDSVTAVMPGTITYSISNGSLPDGVTLDPATGAVTGAPTAEGNFYFTIQATNGTDTLTWTYAGLIGPTPPAPFVAPANGKYKWSRNNTDITWDASAQAVRYVVKWRNTVICESIVPKCVALGRVPNDKHVTITAYDRADNSLTGDATFVPSALQRLGVTPHFASNSAVLTAGDKAKLKKLASYLKKHGITKLLLIGYTDITGPVGVDPGLSMSRARAVKAYLGQFMSVKNVTIKGLGRLYPAKSNKTAAGRAANRRVEIWTK
jgi:outer membrane protein OmpA-like peptidoglycan-associated protein